jgi:hypothetical protein
LNDNIASLLAFYSASKDDCSKRNATGRHSSCAPVQLSISISAVIEHATVCFKMFIDVLHLALFQSARSQPRCLRRYLEESPVNLYYDQAAAPTSGEGQVLISRQRQAMGMLRSSPRQVELGGSQTVRSVTIGSAGGGHLQINRLWRLMANLKYNKIKISQMSKEAGRRKSPIIPSLHEASPPSSKSSCGHRIWRTCSLWWRKAYRLRLTQCST